MEIKSNFKDYYDFALSGIIYDIDKSVVYSRLLDVLKYNGNNIKNDNILLNYLVVIKLLININFICI